MPSKKKTDTRKMRESLRRFIRSRGEDYLRDPNVNSIGIGYKIKTELVDGVPVEKQTKEISIQFTVGAKSSSALEMVELETRELPKSIVIDGVEVPTDVIERSFKPSYEIEKEALIGGRKQRLDPMQPGVSIGHGDITAGTFGAVVYDRKTGAPCILSNWHVLRGPTGKIGDKIFQPGPDDDNKLSGNECAVLLRSHLGAVGDCAVARIIGRSFEPEIYDLEVVPRRMARVELGDRLVKSGRTSDVTHGVVRRVDVMARIGYGGSIGEQAIGCFEIGPDDDHIPSDGEISRGGDSGAVWLIHDHKNGATTDLFAGLHFAGEGLSNPDEHALACYPRSVTKKLDVMLAPLAVTDDDTAAPEAMMPRAGYDPDFLGQHVPMPGLTLSFKQDAVNFDQTDFVPYTHFTVCLSKRRRLARFVAWNIDGARKVTLGGKSFRKDGRVPEDTQLGNDVYIDNKLDRGHLARRADLAWGPIPEARQANSDSYFYTNIAPQHEAFNRSSMNGLWGELENLILTQAATRDIRVSVIGGPVFKQDDPVHRGAKIPRSFWKVVAYMGEDDQLRTAAFVLSQRELVAALEGLDLDPFRMFQITLAELATTTGLDFSNLSQTDVLANPELRSPLPELAAAAAEQITAFDRVEREVNGSTDLVL